MSPGGIYYANTSIAGVAIPPQSHPDLVFVQLTAGLTGSGQYNEGKLTGESVSGSAPLVTATAVVNVAGSPVNGKTIHLLNTEGRILRPSETAGTLQNDQDQKITGYIKKAGNVSLMWSTGTNDVAGAFETVAGGGTYRPYAESNSTGLGVTFDSSRVVRAGDETRMKNIGVTAYMRVK